jgi:hypothetical protein
MSLLGKAMQQHTVRRRHWTCRSGPCLRSGSTGGPHRLSCRLSSPGPPAATAVEWASPVTLSPPASLFELPQGAFQQNFCDGVGT